MAHEPSAQEMGERQLAHLPARATRVVAGDQRVADEQRERQQAPHLRVGVVVRERVRFTGLDGHWAVMLLADALAGDVLLADRLDGASLDARHGAPVRLVAPAHYGFVNVKHLCRIELLTGEPAQSTGAASGLAGAGLRLLGYGRFTRARVWKEERHAVLPAGVIRLVGRVVVGHALGPE